MTNSRLHAISESHLTQYQRFQGENKAKEDYKPEKNGVCKALAKQTRKSRRKFAKPELARGLAIWVAKRIRKSQKAVNFTHTIG